MKIYCDGGARGNPGPAAAAFVVFGEAGNLVYKDAKFLGVATNNVAEYTALVMALDWLSGNASEDVKIILDSELVKKQMTGEYRIKNINLRTLAMRARSLAKQLKYSVSYHHTLREGNPLADALVNETLDKYAR